MLVGAAITAGAFFAGWRLRGGAEPAVFEVKHPKPRVKWRPGNPVQPIGPELAPLTPEDQRYEAQIRKAQKR
jgi:hypothetical protein